MEIGRPEVKERIRPIKRAVGRLCFFTAEQRETIHEASLRILETTGVVFALEEAREFLSKAGARVEGETVKFPRGMIESALALLPGEFTLCGRAPDGSEDMTLDGLHSYMNLDGTGMDVLDAKTGERRKSTLKDLEDATRLADWLPQISYVWPIATAGEYPERTQPLWEAFAQFSATTKHIMPISVARGPHAAAVIEMASILAGGRDALKRKPIISTFLCATSPLSFVRGACEAIIEFAGAGLPTGIMTMPISGATAPLSVAGNLAQINAETLAGIALIQAVNPGCPSFYASCATFMELRSGGITSNGPEDYLLQAGVVAMGREKYGIPVMTGIMGTEARWPGWQAGVEDALSCFTSVLCGADLMPGAGLLKNATTLCFEELIMGCEIYEMIKRTAEGAPVDPDSLAVDVIESVGPRGHFMTEEHTIANIKNVWQPSVTRRCSYDAWEDSGRADALEAASDYAAWILDSHRPEILTDQQQGALRAVIENF
jgi:trimethylamine--corrinoid protein Co-methyltransferase